MYVATMILVLLLQGEITYNTSESEIYLAQILMKVSMQKKNKKTFYFQS